MLSVIICTYNRDKYIYTTLEKLAKNNLPFSEYEIILVNNLCTDKTEEKCFSFHSQYPSVNFRYFIEENQGLSYARNRGIKEAIGDMFVFLDDDAFVDVDYLANLTLRMNEYPDLSAFGGKITPFYESGKEPEWMSSWSYSWVSAMDKGDNVVLFEENDYPIGANMGIKRGVVEQCGCFNVKLGRKQNDLSGGEEKDLFFRLKSKGLKIYYLPNVKVEHCIPEKRTTKDYIIRLGNGIGRSESARTREISLLCFLYRCVLELIKWGGTIVLWLSFVLKGKKSKGDILVVFRYYVTRGLLSEK